MWVCDVKEQQLISWGDILWPKVHVFLSGWREERRDVLPPVCAVFKGRGSGGVRPKRSIMQHKRAWKCEVRLPALFLPGSVHFTHSPDKQVVIYSKRRFRNGQSEHDAVVFLFSRKQTDSLLLLLLLHICLIYVSSPSLHWTALKAAAAAAARSDSDRHHGVRQTSVRGCCGFCCCPHLPGWVHYD